MSKPIPIYRAEQEVFQADTCQPLVDAAARGEVDLEALVHGHYPGRKLAPGALPGVKTVGFWDAPAAQSWGLPWHRNEGVELTLLESGKLPFAVDEASFLLHPGDITVTRPWERHRLGNPDIAAGRLHWIILDVGVRRPNQEWRWPDWLVLTPADIAELTNILRHTEKFVLRASADLRKCFQALATAVTADRNGSSISTLTVKINECFLLLLDLLRRNDIPLDESLSSSRRTVELFLEDLRTHPEHLAIPWSVEQMASSCGLRVTQFVHHVRCLTNVTPMHYVNHCRLEYAAKLLLEKPGRIVTDIALDCGFSSSQYFATAFGAKYHCTPKEYRQRRLQAAAGA